MKTTLKIFVLLAVMTLATPFPLQAGKVRIDQVRQNVRNLLKPIKEGQPSILAKKFKEILASEEKFILLDVRSEVEFKAAHLPGALHIERGKVEWFVPNIIKDTDRKIYVYCRTGARSAFAAERLIEMGYSNVNNIYDGFRGWVTNGYTVYNMHGEFIISPGGFEKKEPRVGNLP